MKVLLSIKPEFAEKILKGEKRYEYRKSLFKNPKVDGVIIYATMPMGKVVGEFDIGEIITGIPEQVWTQTSTFSGISGEFFTSYFEGRKMAYAIGVQNPRRYDQPVPLNEVINRSCPPQSFCYV